MTVPLTLFFLTITILPFTTTVAVISSCNQTCGDTRVNYPFGFSPTCKFPLTCNTKTNKTLFHGFPLRNLTSDHLLLSLSSNCTRPITSLTPLFSKTHSLTSQTSLLLTTCSPSPSHSLSSSSTCSLPWNLLESPPSSCGPHSSNLTCYTSNNSNVLMREEDLGGTGCKFVFSSIVVHGEGNDVSLEFQALQVAWWVSGTCRCDPNANCTTVGASGYRCKCNDGFSGDGFVDGLGCVPSGNSLKFVPSRYGRTKILIGGIVAGAALMAIVATMCYFCRRHSTYLKSRTSARRLLSEATGNSIVPQYSYREIERATNGFSEKQRLGTGAYGTVYSGKLYNNNECVAIKKIKHRDTESIDQVMNEIKLISSVSHPNLVRLLGCCIENGEQILVYEYMPNGTLSEHLQRERGKALPWTVRLTIAAETAQAIAYLHSAMNPPIYHRDIKSSNILLDYEYKSKVADFGLSRLGMMEISHISTAPQGTPGYVDPQYHQNFHLSDKSDVYSFGVVLVEIITAMKVVDFNRPHTEVNLAALAVDRIGKGCMDEIIDPYIELHRDAWTLSSVHKMAELAFRCLAYHKDMRPSMMEVAHELEQIRLSGWAPLDDNIGMGSSVASSCSSPINGSERSLGGIPSKKVVGSRRLIVPQKGVDHLASLEEGKDTSPVSVHDPWFSEQSSPSTNSLLANVIH